MPAGDAAYAMRSEGFNSLVLAEWTDPAQTDPCTKWGRDSDAALQPFVGTRRYVRRRDRRNCPPTARSI